MHWRRKWQPTPVFLPGESQGRGASWAAVHGVTQSQTQLKQLSSSSSMDHLIVTKASAKYQIETNLTNLNILLLKQTNENKFLVCT